MDRAEAMNKNFRYAVFLSLFFQFDFRLYQEMFKSEYETGASPMSRISVILSNDGQNRADSYAKELLASPPKVVE